MDRNRINLIICLALSRDVGDREAMVAKFAVAEHNVEFCANKMLKHGPNVIIAPANSLQVSGLVEKIVDVGAKRLAWVEVELRAL
jgi:hypothetical protein